MGLLFGPRRAWTLTFVAISVLPLVGFVASGTFTRLTFPADWWTDPAARLTPVIDRNFGFRTEIRRWHGALRHAVMSPPNRNVFYGLDGQLFFGGDDAVQQSTGAIFRKARLDRFVGMAVRLNGTVSAYGGTLVVGSPPNAQTILSGLLPAWAVRSPGLREYDYALQSLRARGVAVVDLRQSLEAAQKRGPTYYKTDTHWNMAGALIAFNETMRTAGRSDLTIRASDALEPVRPGSGGDLATLLGVESMVEEEFTVPIKDTFLSQTQIVEAAPIPGHAWNYAVTTSSPGPSVLVIGDSFTLSFWRPLLAHVSQRVHWIHLQGCRFDWAQALNLKADIVLLMPTERHLGCLRNRSMAPKVQARGP